MSIRKVTQKLLAPVIIVLVVAMTVGVFYISPMMTKDNGGYKGPAARLNGEKIKDADFNSVMFSVSQQAMQMAQYGIAYTDAQIRDQALDSAIGDLAFKQEMKKEGSKINVSGAEVDKFIKDRWPTEEELQSAMQQYGQADKGQFKKWIADQLK
ncbi:MAG TPA: SurA N-terminal domain-containing protein, partial [Bacillota bacterium]